MYAEHLTIATSFYQRARGLLGRTHMNKGEGLYIPACRSVHTIFMQFPIDIIFLDKDNAVTKIFTALLPFRVAFGSWRTRGVLELPGGIVKESGCIRGDTIYFAE